MKTDDETIAPGHLRAEDPIDLPNGSRETVKQAKPTSSWMALLVACLLTTGLPSLPDGKDEPPALDFTTQWDLPETSDRSEATWSWPTVRKE